MNCKNCGAELFETSKFCPECGTPVEAVSPAALEEKNKEMSEPLQEAHEKENTAADNKAEKEQPADKPAAKPSDKPLAEEITEEKTDTPPETEAPAEEPVIPTVEEIKENLEAVESIIEDLPEITVIEHVEDIPVQTPEQEDVKPDTEPVQNTEKAYEVSEESPVQTEETPKKKHSGIVIAAIIIAVIAIIAAAAAYLLSRNSPKNVPDADQTVTEAIEYTSGTVTEFTENVTEISETETEKPITEETTVSDTEISETEVSETETEETVSEEETSETVSETAAEEGEIVIVPETHDFAMGTSISAEISLSAAGASESLTDTTLITAYHNSRVEHLGPKPVIALIQLSDDVIEVEPSECGDEMSVFEYSKFIEAVASSGHFPNEIDIISFRSNGAPVDVYSVSIINQ